MKKMIVFLMLLIGVLFFALIAPVQAETESIKLIWSHDVPADLAGFRVFMAPNGAVTPCPNITLEDDTNVIADLEYDPENPSFTTTYQVTGAPLQVFYFNVTAYDFAGNESGCSVHATYTIPADTTPPGAPFDLIIEVIVLPE
jgi:hypothetical protein